MMKFTLELRIPIAWETWLRQTICGNVEIEIQKQMNRNLSSRKSYNAEMKISVSHPKWRDEVEGGKDLLDVLKIAFCLFLS